MGRHRATIEALGSGLKKHWRPVSISGGSGAFAVTIHFVKKYGPESWAAWADEMGGAAADWVTGGLAVVTAIALVWALYRSFHDLRVDRDERRTPKLSLDFGTRARPFYQEADREHNGEPVTIHICRVGVVNHSDVMVNDVEVRLESSVPQHPAIYPGHRLRVMGSRDGSETTRVGPCPDGKPGAYFDVVAEIVNRQFSSDGFYIAYAGDSIPQMRVNEGEYEFSLRVDGGGVPTTAKCHIRKKHGNAGRVEIVEASPPQ